MANILLLSSAMSAAIAAIAASRGTGAANLLTNDPKEVWSDSAVGTAATIDIDLGAVKSITSLALIAVYGAAAAASWTITAGVSGYTETTLKVAGALRAVDAAGQAPSLSHALWTGEATSVRFVRISLTQPAGSSPLQIGRVLIGAAFQPVWNKEWGAGRGVIDTGTASRLLSGGLGVVEGARLGQYGWTLGDLTDAEVETLYVLQLEVGETLPLLVVEDPAATAGQRNRIHYGRLIALRRFERRSPGRTRWELTMEEWI